MAEKLSYYSYDELIDMRNEWTPVFIISSLIYLPFIFILKYFVVDRFEDGYKQYLSKFLSYPWSAWCICLSGFSLLGTLTTLHYMTGYGFEVNIFETYASHFYLAFIFSKIVELIDTVFIVLRSKPLVALQYYHHWATLLISWYSMYYYCNEFIFAMFLNYFVHTFMYAYYAIYPFHPNLVRKFGNFVNIIQTLQMFIAIIFLIHRFFNNTFSCQCDFNKDEAQYPLYIAIVMYFTYAVLFIQVFFDRQKRLAVKKTV